MVKTLLAALVLVVAVAVGVAAAPDDRPREADLAAALRALPDVTLTAGFTDWAAVGAATGDDLAAARTDDLTTASVLVDAVDEMDAAFGFSVLDADWEAIGQAREGAVLLLRLDETVALDDVTTQLDRLGYARPDRADGVWTGGVDLVAGIDASLTPLLAHVGVDADEHLLVMSDALDYARRAMDVATTGADSLLDDAEVADAATPLLGSVVAVLHRGDRACAVTGYASAAELDRRDAVAAAHAVGSLAPQQVLGFGIAAHDGGYRLDVAMRFADAATASAQQPVRSTLARGPAIGQGGSYDERFALTSSVRDGAVITLGLTPRDTDMTLMSDLASGPLMFAWCGG